MRTSSGKRGAMGLTVFPSVRMSYTATFSSLATAAENGGLKRKHKTNTKKGCQHISSALHRETIERTEAGRTCWCTRATRPSALRPWPCTSPAAPSPPRAPQRACRRGRTGSRSRARVGRRRPEGRRRGDGGKRRPDHGQTMSQRRTSQRGGKKAR